ncbi:MAG: hypothetical protein IKI77_10960, partial [Oscillospiraceae bacterium]|nr:hypothetical protein [Oscillospiraceae bacterium]
CKNGLWEAATCQYNESLCKNYIFPFIGDCLISKIETRDLQLFYNNLPGQKAVRQRTWRVICMQIRYLMKHAILIRTERKNDEKRLIVSGR